MICEKLWLDLLRENEKAEIKPNKRYIYLQYNVRYSRKRWIYKQVSGH